MHGAAGCSLLERTPHRLWRQPGHRRRAVHLICGAQQQQRVGAQVDPRGRRRAARRRGAPLIAQVAGAADERRGGRHDLVRGRVRVRIRVGVTTSPA